MALEGKLIADFSSVPTESEKALVALGRMETGATKSAAALDRIQAPAGLKTLPPTAIDARLAIDGLGTALGQTDQVLSAFGVHIGPQVRALKELADASNSTIADLGGVATAGLSIGAGLAGWGIGRAISGFFDLDKTIGDATAKLLGWGDVAAAEAAAGSDVLARASKEVGFQINDMTSAIIINKGALADWQAAAKTANDAVARLDAPRKSAEALAKLRGELDTLKGSGVINSLRDDIKSQAFSVNELAERYRISVEALRMFNREEQTAIDLVHQHNAQIIKDLQAQLDRDAAVRKAAADAKAARDAEADAAMKAAQAAHDLGVAFDDAQRLAKQQTDATTAALKLQKDAADAVARAMGNTIEYDLSTKEGMAQFRRLNPGASVNTPEGYFQTHTLADAVRDGLVNFYAKYAGGQGGSERAGPLPAPLVTGALGSRGATLVGPSDVVVTVNVSGMNVMDPASIRMFTKVMSDELLTRVKMGRQFGSA